MIQARDAKVVSLAPAVRLSLAREVRRALPREACGTLLGRSGGRETRVLALHSGANVHPRPTLAFELDPGAVVAAAREARTRGLDLLGFFHSHPSGPAGPSAEDLAAGWEGHLGLIAVPGPGGSLLLRAFRMSRHGWEGLPILSPCG